MKSILYINKLWTGIALAGMLSGFGWAQSPGDGERSDGVIAYPGVHIQVEDIREPMEGSHRVKVIFPWNVLESSIGDGDLWVVSQNGYNRTARLESVEKFDDIIPIEGRPEPDPTNPEPYPMPYPLAGYAATYTIDPPSNAGWTEADNGRYAILLEPDEVLLEDGRALAADLLGSFQARIGIPDPPRPLETHIRIIQNEGNVTAAATLVFPNSGYSVDDWGEVDREGSLISATVSITGPPDDVAVLPVITEIKHEYNLGELERGHYRFALYADGDFLGGQGFAVPEEQPHVPADVQLNVDVVDPQSAKVHAVIHFIDPYFVLSDPGEPKRDGNLFVIDATAQQVVFVRPPDEPAITEVDYKLEIPEPGEYSVLFRLNGHDHARAGFFVPRDFDQKPVIHSFRAHPETVRPGQAVTLEWNAFNAETLEISPQVGRVEGSRGSVTVVPSEIQPMPVDANGEPADVEGELPPGDYTVVYTLTASNEFGETQSRASVKVGAFPDDPDFPVDAKIDIQQGDASHFAEVHLDLPPHVFVIHWGELERRENRFMANVELARYPDILFDDPNAVIEGEDGIILPPPPEEPWHVYNLGVLDPGHYAFALTANGDPVKTVEFKAPDIEDPPSERVVKAELRSSDITEAGGEFHDFHVIYSSEIPLDLESLGDDDIFVQSWVILARFTGEPPLWAGQKAELIEVESAEENRRVNATYRIHAPEGGWSSEMNGNLFVQLNGESVANKEGTFAKPRQLGEINIRVDEAPSIPVEVELGVERTDEFVLLNAKAAFFDFPYYSITDWGEPVQDGPYFIINATAHEVAFFTEPDLPIIEEHQYRLIDLKTDELRAHDKYQVWFNINGERYAETSFVVGDGDGEGGPTEPEEGEIVPGEVRISVEPTDEGGAANVNVELDFTNLGFPITLVDWGEALMEEEGIYYISTQFEKVEYDPDMPPPPGAQPVFSNGYHLEDLRPGKYQVHVLVNGKKVARTVFVIAGENVFLNWLGDWLKTAQAETAGFARDAAFERADDFDGDGKSDFEEWALGLNPVDPEVRNGVLPELIHDNGQSHFAIKFKRRPPEDPVSYTISVSGDLKNWESAEGRCSTVETKTTADGMEEVVVCLDKPISETGVQFLRLEIRSSDQN